MATRGVKPSAAHLRLVTGTHRTARHGDAGEARDKVEAATAAFGKLAQPKGMRGEALAAWKRYVAPAGWLDVSREALAIAFCELWAEFRQSPTKFPASRHGQLRAYMSELGLTDERNRVEKPGEKKDEFFDD